MLIKSVSTWCMKGLQKETHIPGHGSCLGQVMELNQTFSLTILDLLRTSPNYLMHAFVHALVRLCTAAIKIKITQKSMEILIHHSKKVWKY